MKPQPGDLVRVEWLDPQSESGWTEKWDLQPSLCVNYGVFFGYENGCLRLFAGFNDAHEMGDKIVIPKSLIQGKIKVIKRNVRKTNS